MTADDRSLGVQAAIAMLTMTPVAYLLPGATALDHQLPALRPACAALRSRLRIEQRTADGTGCALTFDDGPHREGTPAVLKVLADARVKATFFLVGEQVRANPSLAREILAEGHLIGLHCDRHRNLLRLGPTQVSRDLAGAEAAIGEATGQALTLYRPPYGILNAAALRIARRRGWRTLLWSNWGRDWDAKATPASIASLVTRDASPGAVLLLHDADDYGAAGCWRNTVAALPRVLERLEAANLRLTVP